MRILWYGKWKRLFTDEAKDYLNSYPAYQEARGGLMDNDFYTRFVYTWLDGDKQIRDPNDCRMKYRYCVQECTDIPFTLQDAEEFLKWLDPMWCEYKGITDSGFFTKDSVTLGEDEDDFIV